MKIKLSQSPALLTICLMAPAAADTIYSGLQDIPIPTTIGGVFLDVDAGTWSNTTFTGWDINPFFGGVAVGNSSTFQPARETTGNLATILNLAAGTLVAGDNAALHFASGAGGSENHLALTSGNDKFVAGTEGYLGFKLGANFGWMRVVFNGDNSANAVIKDWAYDNSGGAIAVGGIQQSAPDNGTQTVTLSSATGESFTLASQITNTGGVSNNVNKTGTGTAVLTGANTYTGTTTVSLGRLLVNNTTGSGTGSGAVDVAGGATLGGTGSIAGALNVSGVLAPGASVATLAGGTLTMNGGSVFQYEVDSGVAPSVGADLQTITGDVTLNDNVTLSLADLAGSPSAFANGTTFSLINYSGIWKGGSFTYNFGTLADGAQFAAGLNTWRIDYHAAEGGSNFSGEYLGGADSFVNITAVPETGVSLLGGFGVLALLRRRRHA